MSKRKKINWTNVGEIIEKVNDLVLAVKNIFDDEDWKQERIDLANKLISIYNIRWLPDYFEVQIYCIILDIVRDFIIRIFELDSKDHDKADKTPVKDIKEDKKEKDILNISTNNNEIYE